MSVWYATREDVKSALDFKETARNNLQIDRAIESASRSIEGMMHRRFYPQTATRYFDWPSPQPSRTWRLWLEEDELASLTSLTAGGVAVTSSNYFLEPANQGPPYDRIEINLASASAFASNSGTHQRSIVATGVFAGCVINELAGGTTAEVLDATETDIDISDSSLIGVGSIIRIDSERFLVTGKTMITTGQTLGGAGLTAVKSDVTVPVSTGSSFAVGEIILIDSERMLIVDISGNNLTVQRAWDGTVLAVHSSSTTIYAPRALIVTRGALGTTAATHLTSAPIFVFEVPGLIRSLCVAESLAQLGQDSAGWVRTAGSGDNQQEAREIGLEGLRRRAKSAYQRLRIGAA